MQKTRSQIALLCVLLAALRPGVATADVYDAAVDHVRQSLMKAHPHWRMDEMTLQVQIRGARGSATQACPHAWTWSALDIKHWSRIEIPVYCGTTAGSLAAQVQINANVWVLRHDLPKGHVLRRQDLVQSRQTVQSPGALGPAEQWLGLPLRKSLPAGATAQVQRQPAPPYVRKGERIEIQATEGDIVVTAPGIALHTARQGSALRARNIASQAVVTGVLIAPNVLRAGQRSTGGVKVELESID